MIYNAFFLVLSANVVGNDEFDKWINNFFLMI